MSAFKEEFDKVFKKKDNQLVIIIAVNVIVFILFNIISLSDTGKSILKEWVAVDSSIFTWLTHFWTTFTYMFVHFDLRHIFFNMLILFFMGRVLESQIGGRRFAGLFMLGGLAGAVLYVVAYNIMIALNIGDIQHNTLIGASAGVMAILIALAVLIPNQKINMMFFGPVSIKYVAYGLFIVSSILDMQENTGGKIAHIGGAIFGYFYIIQYRKGKDYAGNFYNFITSLSGLFKSKKKQNMKVEHRKPTNDDDYNLHRKRDQDKIDSILDKISKSGYDSLNAEEKRILFKESNKNN
ncbi:MAG: rhomboid family intramembrane serine protease [Flavobacteriales bacterium]|nr:rhomboid family intramembrane serine protease [Flavobacteriales bacterium]